MSAQATPRRRLRILPAPETRPPIISPDELEAARHSPYVQDSLALDFDADDMTVPALFTRRVDLPDPAALVARLAQAFVEVMAGIRPAPQIVRYTSPEVYAALCRRRGRRHPPAAWAAPTRGGAPGPGAGAGRRRRGGLRGDRAPGPGPGHGAAPAGPGRSLDRHRLAGGLSPAGHLPRRRAFFEDRRGWVRR